MITKTIQKNKFGGQTWEFKLDSLHHIFMNETDSESFVVEFKEWKLFNYKTHFSFVSNDNLKNTISLTLDKIHLYFSNNQKKYSFSIEQKNKKKNELINFVEVSQLNQNKPNILISSIKEKYSLIISFFELMPFQKDIKESKNFIKISFSSVEGEFFSETKYIIKEDNDKIYISFVQKNQDGIFPLEWEYNIGTDQKIILEDFKNDFKSLSNEIQKKKLDDYLNNYF